MSQRNVSVAGGFYTTSETYSYANSLIEKKMEFATSLFRATLKGRTSAPNSQNVASVAKQPKKK